MKKQYSRECLFCGAEFLAYSAPHHRNAVRCCSDECRALYAHKHKSPPMSVLSGGQSKSYYAHYADVFRVHEEMGHVDMVWQKIPLSENMDHLGFRRRIAELGHTSNVFQECVCYKGGGRKLSHEDFSVDNPDKEVVF